jgi:hypothetical protein
LTVQPESQCLLLLCFQKLDFPFFVSFQAREREADCLMSFQQSLEEFQTRGRSGINLIRQIFFSSPGQQKVKPKMQRLELI